MTSGWAASEAAARYAHLHLAGNLSPGARAACEDLGNTLVLSVAGVWEMQIKQQLGKLALVTPLERVIADQQAVNAVTLLPVELAHVLALSALPPLHRDPFDRILVAQAIVEDATLVTADGRLPGYPVNIFRVT
jgi:PIN domain nuclease of toxin-antitoxin system